MAIKVFCCYAHGDEPLLNTLKTHLRPLEREGLIDVWHDRDISAGTEWEREIGEQLNKAQIILLLVSPDFIDSDYCYGIEMERAMERHEHGEAHVIPVILRPVYWQGAKIGKLQALPTDGKPVTDEYWRTLDHAFFSIVQGIREVIRLLSSQESDNPSGDLELSKTLDVRTETSSPYQVLVKTSVAIDTTVLDPGIRSLDVRGSLDVRVSRGFETDLAIEYKISIGGILDTTKVEKRNLSSE